MEQVGMFEAKTHFSEIVDRVVREGRPITVTRRGVPVVEISPLQDARTESDMTKEEAIEEIMRLRAELPKIPMQEILDAIAEGRR